MTLAVIRPNYFTLDLKGALSLWAIMSLTQKNEMTAQALRVAAYSRPENLENIDIPARLVATGAAVKRLSSVRRTANAPWLWNRDRKVQLSASFAQYNPFASAALTDHICKNPPLQQGSSLAVQD
ncbi:hypothetical protein GCM10007385_05920 [Tateyamaria omphalii]|uniref:hypothetical protein n=1 Tax=Tateyamaria omphalii TaxID=299262 RepID=UPI001678C665|nr:hypothetical protein [Tateyamaria omphalii]GGX41217.1 hypothetical protein GCM10007385_05920 [Tateyamaria omphalii]